jgi:NAD-dependent SIR2 family protein deacetylase
MTELFLLGAGASVEAGIPDSYSMTKVMLEKFSVEPRYRRIEQILQFVVGGLLFQQGIKGENPYDGVNIEDLFNAVILLGDRKNSELGPFISSWHPQLVGLESGRLDSFMGRHLLEAIYDPIEKYMHESIQVTDHGTGHHHELSFRSRKIDTFFSSRFEDILANAIRQVVVGGEGELFNATAATMILKLVEMVWITDPEKTRYLVPLIQYVHHTNSAIVTLNYDNAIELAGHIEGLEIDTGFDSWSNTGDFSFYQGKIPFLKLHGSIDWALSNGQIAKEKPLPFQVIEKVNPDLEQQRNFHPAVIFGGKNKLTAKGPFLSLLRAFDRELSKSEVLWIIGYSFHDEHVNEFITNWFNGNPARVVRIINPKPDSLNTDFSKYLLQGMGNERVKVISEIASVGISNLAKIYLANL